MLISRSLSLSCWCVCMREHTYNHPSITKREKSKRGKERQWGQSFVDCILPGAAERKRTRANCWDDVNTASSFVLLMLLFLLMQDITNRPPLISCSSVLLIERWFFSSAWYIYTYFFLSLSSLLSTALVVVVLWFAVCLHLTPFFSRFSFCLCLAFLLVFLLL